MRVLLISNLHARLGKEPLDPALEVFARAGIEAEQATVPRGRDAPDLIRERGPAFDSIVLAGGDGTLHSAAPALIELGRPIGFLPRGTANDFARAVGLPLGLAEAAEAIAAGTTRAVDIGEVNGKPFFNVAHIGLGAALAEALTAGMKQSMGPFAYPVAAARSLSGLRPFRAEIVIGQERTVLRAFAITVGNGRFFGGSGIVAEDATIDDGVFHLFAVTTKNPVRLAMMLPDIARGSHGRSKWVQTAVAPELELYTARPMRIRADGKLMTETPAVFRVRPRALSVFAPSRA